MNRNEAPAFSQAQDLNLIFPEKIELENGAVLYWLKDVKDNSVKLDIEWDAGTKYQPKRLLASYTNRLLLSGTKEKSASEIAEEMDFFGGYAQVECDSDHAGIVLYGLNENIHSIFEVFATAFDQAGFPEKELKKEVEIGITKFRIECEKVKTLCRREFTKNLYGAETAYGKVAQETDFKSLRTEDLKKYYQEKYRKAPVIFLTGAVDSAFIDKLRKWTSNFAAPAKQPFEQEFVQRKGEIHLPKEGAIQSAIRIGRLMFDKNHPDYFKFQLMNTIFGGYFGSRLMANIREDKGYTYGIGSGMAVLQDAAYFFISTEVGADVREKAIQEIINEMELLKSELISVDELTKVKNYMLGEFLRHADGPIALMEVFKNIYFNSLSKSYYSDFIQAIHDTTVEDVQLLAQKYLNKDELLIISAG